MDGFSLHAATRAGALDASGREALLRCVLRPPIAQDRIEQGFPDRRPPKLHVTFYAGAPRPSPLAEVDLASYAPEESRLVGGDLYLHLPGGIDRSRLAADLARRKGPSGTTRNWRTVTKLLEIAEGLREDPRLNPARPRHPSTAVESRALHAGAQVDPTLAAI